MREIVVSGVGCCLVDRVYNHVSFTSEAFSSFLSKERGDGGLSPGHLVFKEEFETFVKEDFRTILGKITNYKPPDKLSIGGPCIVAMINAAQVLENKSCHFRFYGHGGKDDDGEFLMSALKRTPVDTGQYTLTDDATPSTVVLSDPDYERGHGERIFINSIGAAWNYSPDNLDEDFFSSDIVVFGGTALVPQIHDNLTSLLKQAKAKGCITIVNTVFDFRNEKANPDKKWPLGESDESYRNIDLLITDFEEALRLSGKRTIDHAMQFFRDKGSNAVIVTNGPNNLRGFSTKNSLFFELGDFEMPVSEEVSRELKKGRKGDTTGCGDNFAGGVIAGLVLQLQLKQSPIDLREAVAWGVVSGGYTCFYIGGTYFEEYPGEKYNLLLPYYEKYKKQIRTRNEIIRS